MEPHEQLREHAKAVSAAFEGIAYFMEWTRDRIKGLEYRIEQMPTQAEINAATTALTNYNNIAPGIVTGFNALTAEVAKLQQANPDLDLTGLDAAVTNSTPAFAQLSALAPAAPAVDANTGDQAAAIDNFATGALSPAPTAVTATDTSPMPDTSSVTPVPAAADGVAAMASADATNPTNPTPADATAPGAGSAIGG